RVPWSASFGCHMIESQPGCCHCYGVRILSRPSSFRSFSELTSPSALSIRYVSLVPVGPARLNPEAGSDAPSFTEGRPFSVLRRSNTVSAYASPFAERPAGRTLMLARTRPWSSTISRARPRRTGAPPSANAGPNWHAAVSTRRNRFSSVSAATTRGLFIHSSDRGDRPILLRSLDIGATSLRLEIDQERRH